VISHVQTSAEVPAVIIHHRPRVEKKQVFWYSLCVCGHINHYVKWRHALVDALIHSDRLK
jgi:hypothetical protein